MKIMQLTCLNAADPLPKLGRKVEAPKPISAEEKRALEIAAFESIRHGMSLSQMAEAFKGAPGEAECVGAMPKPAVLKAPHDGTGYIESETVTFADVGEVVDYTTLLGHYETACKRFANHICVDIMLKQQFGTHWLVEIPLRQWPAVIAALEALQ